ncbi:reverse transcriptase [Gossypium australe]|uniref:Reverse transcriptase n=1 Tax=Gossypium australe TaxID=47621 RepID=A0A5B6VE93_9ROSI|nr:reverse transcriptase [Gossypium australe]
MVAMVPQLRLDEGAEAKQSSTEEGQEGDSETFGPWMIVERKSRNNSWANYLSKKENKGKGKSGSRFEALADFGDKSNMENTLIKEGEERIAEFQVLLKDGIKAREQNLLQQDNTFFNKGRQLGAIIYGAEPTLPQNSGLIIKAAGRPSLDVSNIENLAGPQENCSKSDPSRNAVVKGFDKLGHFSSKSGPSNSNTNGSPLNFIVVTNDNGAFMSSDSSFQMPTVVEAKEAVSLGGLNARHTAVSFKDKGLAMDGNKNRNTGCASSKFLRAFREYNFEYKPDIVCLLEPRVSGTKANSIIDKLGFERSHRIESIGFSRGLWVGWKEYISINIIQNHPQFMLLHLQYPNLNNGFFMFVFYGHPDRSKRKSLWADLMNVLPQEPLPWLILGDFNAILSPKDKKSDRTIGKRCKFFGNFIDVCNLQDLGFIGTFFTWQRGNTSARLDRALANDAWISEFPHTLVYHLPRIKSDHRPILIKTNPELSLPRGRPFCFLAGWTKHANFKELVRLWFLGTHKRDLLKSLGIIQKAMDQSYSRRLATLEMEVRDELESVLNHEELLWRQKVRCDWLQLGDKNTSFFHRRMIQQRKFNRILALRVNNGKWCSNQSILSGEAVIFFEKLYGEKPRSMADIPANIFPCLKEQFIDFLSKPVPNEEINKALFDMAPLKAPGSDGFYAHFFQSQWDLVGGAVCEWVQGIFAGNRIERELNNTLIVFIPKKDRSEDFS